jgi:hypothetical protein
MVFFFSYSDTQLGLKGELSVLKRGVPEIDSLQQPDRLYKVRDNKNVDELKQQARRGRTIRRCESVVWGNEMEKEQNDLRGFF